MFCSRVEAGDRAAAASVGLLVAGEEVGVGATTGDEVVILLLEGLDVTGLSVATGSAMGDRAGAGSAMEDGPGVVAGDNGIVAVGAKGLPLVAGLGASGGASSPPLALTLTAITIAITVIAVHAMAVFQGNGLCS